MKKLTYIVLFFTTILIAQRKKQPKIGLVLSGGGAKGFSHVGVLKEIEKAGIQIDYISGTSMGAIIGGLYTSGYTADEIEKRIKDVEFDKLLQDKIPRKDKPLFDKQYQEKHVISLPVTKNGISLPRGISKGQNVKNYFTELFSVVGDVTEFKDLPIPFLCIATDIETGEKVVLDKGNLAQAVQASGALPTLLNPVNIDGRLLIDGGVVDNFPVKELRKRGVDIIIGVDVQNGLADREELKSAIDLLNQIIAFQIYRDSEEQKQEVDVYLHPDLEGMTVMSFDDADKIINSGEEIAKKNVKVLDSISKLQLVKKTIKKIKPVSTHKKFVLDQVDIKGNKDYTEDYILGILEMKLCDSISYHDVSKRINRLTATKNFSKIDYELEGVPDGKKLKLTLNESKDKAFIRLGVHYDETFGLGILGNYTHKRLIADNDILSFDFVFGDHIRYDFNYFVDNGFHLGLGFKSSYKRFDENVTYYTNDISTKINVNFSELLNRVYVQTKFNKKYALSLGADLRTLKAESETTQLDGKPITYESSNYGVAGLNLKIDNFNKVIYPTKGVYFNSDFNWVFYSDRDRNTNFVNKQEFEPFVQATGTFSAVNTFLNKLTLQHTFQGGFSIFNSPTDGFSYKIGGYNKNFPENFVRFYGWESADYLKNNFIKAEAELRYNFYKKHHLLTDVNFIKMGEKNFLGQDGLFDNIYSGYAVGYGLETILGPVELRYAWSPEGLPTRKNMFLFNVGFWF